MSDQIETIADIANVIRIRAANISDGGAMADGAELRDIADRIEAAANRMRDAYCDLCMEKDAAYDRLLLERDRAVQYANAAPHPGSASWKEIQADARKVATLRDSLSEILDRTNREKARDYDAALNGGILEIHDIANTALNQTKGE